MDEEAMKKGVNKKTKKHVETLSYPIALRTEHNEQIVKLLKIAQKVANQRLRQGYKSETLDELKESKKKAYKVLEPILKVNARKKLSSRLNRGVLEVVGRTLRAINDKRELFRHLLDLGSEPQKWNYKKLIKEKGIFAKAEYVKNIAEQTANFIEKNKSLPSDFIQLQKCPKIRKAMISYAPDDGQAIKIQQQDEDLRIELKVPTIEDSKEKQSFQWIKFSIPIPKHLQDKKAVSPDLRLANVHGQWLPILDYKVEVQKQAKQKSEYFLTVDWGTRKLVTVCVFDKQGHQITPPIFLQTAPLLKKLLRIRKEIDSLKSKRDKLHKKSNKFHKYNKEIAKRWSKYRHINTSLSHLAANFIVLIAQIYNCSSIYVEWLNSLKSKKQSNELNWIINTTVRQAVYSRTQYKAHLLGITFAKPLPPAGTSQYCPRCGSKGYHTKASDNLIVSKSGAWFRCDSCGFNADRDYIACCNLARKVLFGNSLKNQTKGVVYKKTPIPDSPTRQGTSPRELLSHNLSGWIDSVFLSPSKIIFAGTLKA